MRDSTVYEVWFVDEEANKEMKIAEGFGTADSARDVLGMYSETDQVMLKVVEVKQIRTVV